MPRNEYHSQSNATGKIELDCIYQANGIDSKGGRMDYLVRKRGTRSIELPSLMGWIEEKEEARNCHDFYRLESKSIYFTLLINSEWNDINGYRQMNMILHGLRTEWMFGVDLILFPLAIYTGFHLGRFYQ